MKFIYTKETVRGLESTKIDTEAPVKRVTVPNVIKVDREYEKYDVYSYQRGEPRLSIFPSFKIKDVVIKFDNEYEMRTFMAEEDGKNKSNLTPTD